MVFLQTLPSTRHTVTGQAWCPFGIWELHPGVCTDTNSSWTGETAHYNITINAFVKWDDSPCRLPSYSLPLPTPQMLLANTSENRLLRCGVNCSPFSVYINILQTENCCFQKYTNQVKVSYPQLMDNFRA